MHSPRSKAGEGSARKAELLQKLKAMKPRNGARSAPNPRHSHRKHVQYNSGEEEVKTKEPTAFQAFHNDAISATKRVQERIDALTAYNEASSLGISESDTTLLKKYTDYTSDPKDRYYRGPTTHTLDILDSLEDTSMWMVDTNRSAVNANIENSSSEYQHPDQGNSGDAMKISKETRKLANALEESLSGSNMQPTPPSIPAPRPAQVVPRAQPVGVSIPGEAGENEDEGEGEGEREEGGELLSPAEAMGLLGAPAARETTADLIVDEKGLQILQEGPYSSAATAAHVASKGESHAIVTHFATRGNRETIYLAKTRPGNNGRGPSHRGRDVGLVREEVIVPPDELFWRGTGEDGLKRPQQSLYDNLIKKTEETKTIFAKNLRDLLARYRKSLLDDVEQLRKEEVELSDSLYGLRHDHVEADAVLARIDIANIQIKQMIEEKLGPSIEKLQGRRDAQLMEIKEIQGNTTNIAVSTLAIKEIHATLQQQISENARKRRDTNAKGNRGSAYNDTEKAAAVDSALVEKAKKCVFEYLQDLKKKKLQAIMELDKSASSARSRSAQYKKDLAEEGQRLEQIQTKEKNLQRQLEIHEAEITNVRDTLRKRSHIAAQEAEESKKKTRQYMYVLDELARARKRALAQEEMIIRNANMKTIRARGAIARADLAYKAAEEKRASFALKTSKLLGRKGPDNDSSVDSPGALGKHKGNVLVAKPLDAIDEVMQEADFDSDAEVEDPDKVTSTPCTGEDGEEGGAAGNDQSDTIDSEYDAILGISKQNEMREARVQAVYDSISNPTETRKAASSNGNTQPTIKYIEGYLRKPVLSSILAAAYGVHSKLYQACSLDPAYSNASSAREFDRKVVAIFDLPEGIEVAMLALTKLRKMECIAENVSEKALEHLNFLRRRTKTLSSAYSDASYEVEVALREITCETVTACLEYVPKRAILKNKHGILSLALQNVFALLAVFKMVNRQSCAEETSRNGSYNKSALENSCRYNIEIAEMEETCLSVLTLIGTGTDNESLHSPKAFANKGYSKKQRRTMRKTMRKLEKTTPMAPKLEAIAQNGGEGDNGDTQEAPVAPVECQKSSLVSPKVASALKGKELTLSIERPAESSDDDSTTATGASSKKSSNPSQLASKKRSKKKPKGKKKSGIDGMDLVRMHADSLVEKLMHYVFQIPSPELRLQLAAVTPLNDLKLAMEAVLRGENICNTSEAAPDTSNGKGYEVRHRNAMIGCELYLTVACASVTEWNRESTLDLYKSCCAQGNGLGITPISHLLPPLKATLKNTNTRIIPAYIAIQLYRKVIEEEISRRRFIVRIAAQDPDVSDLQFLNVTLPSAADAAIGAAIRQERSQEEKEKKEAMNKAMQDAKDAAAAAITPPPGKSRASLLSDVFVSGNNPAKLALEQRLISSRKAWVKGMLAYTDRLAMTVTDLIWRCRLKVGSNGEVVEHSADAFPLPPRLQKRLLDLVEKLKEIAHARRADGASLASRLFPELSACVREVFNVIENLINTMQAFESPMITRYRWIYRQNVALEKKLAALAITEAKIRKGFDKNQLVIETVKECMKVFKDGRLAFEWPDSLARKLIEDPDDDGLQTRLDQGREEFKILQEEQNSLQMEWERLNRSSKRMLTIMVRHTRKSMNVHQLRAQSSMRGISVSAASHIKKKALFDNQLSAVDKVVERQRSKKLDVSLSNEPAPPASEKPPESDTPSGATVDTAAAAAAGDDADEEEKDDEENADTLAELPVGTQSTHKRGRQGTVRNSFSTDVRNKRLKNLSAGTSTSLRLTSDATTDAPNSSRSTLIYNVGKGDMHIPSLSLTSEPRGGTALSADGFVDESASNKIDADFGGINGDTVPLRVSLQEADDASQNKMIRAAMRKRATARVSEESDAGHHDYDESEDSVNDADVKDVYIQEPFVHVLRRGTLDSQRPLPVRFGASFNSEQGTDVTHSEPKRGILIPGEWPEIGKSSNSHAVVGESAIQDAMESSRTSTKNSSQRSTEIRTSVQEGIKADKILQRLDRDKKLTEIITFGATISPCISKADKSSKSLSTSFGAEKQRLVPGDPVAPWLFDLNYLLPEEPLIQALSEEDHVARAHDFAAEKVTALFGSGMRNHGVYDAGDEKLTTEEEIQKFEKLFGIEYHTEGGLVPKAGEKSLQTKVKAKTPDNSVQKKQDSMSAHMQQVLSDWDSQAIPTVNLAAMYQKVWTRELENAKKIRQQKLAFYSNTDSVDSNFSHLQYPSPSLQHDISLLRQEHGWKQEASKASREIPSSLEEKLQTTVLSLTNSLISNEQKEIVLNDYQKHLDALDAPSHDALLDVESRMNASSNNHRWWTRIPDKAEFLEVEAEEAATAAADKEARRLLRSAYRTGKQPSLPDQQLRSPRPIAAPPPTLDYKTCLPLHGVSDKHATIDYENKSWSIKLATGTIVKGTTAGLSEDASIHTELKAENADVVDSAAENPRAQPQPPDGPVPSFMPRLK